MTLTTLPEAAAANAVIHYLTTGHTPTGNPITHDDAKTALAELAEGAHKKLGAGLNRERALKLLDKHWPDPAATVEPDPAPAVVYPSPNLEQLAARVKAARSLSIGTIDVSADTIAELLDRVATPAGQR